MPELHKKLFIYNLNLDFIDAREYNDSRLCRPETFTSFIVEKEITVMYYLIPRLCHLSNISVIVREMLKKHVNFNPLNCPLHKDTSNMFCKVIVSCCLFWWVRKINKIT